MTYQEKVNYLKSYKQLSDRLEYINNRIMGVKAITYDNNHNSEPKQLNDYLDEKDEILENMSNIRDLIKCAIVGDMFYKKNDNKGIYDFLYDEWVDFEDIAYLDE